MGNSCCARQRPKLKKLILKHHSEYVDKNPTLVSTDFNNDETTYMWYENHTLHRVNEPAYISTGGLERWYINGKLHRDDGPAEISRRQHVLPDYDAWYCNGRLHRTDGPAYVSDVAELWYKNGYLHRTDGPAVTDDKFEAWFHEGKLHCEYGPAVTYHKLGRSEWWVNGKQLGGPQGGPRSSHIIPARPFY
jgi:hypothetical protein